MKVNKISFPTFKHLKVNHTEIKDEDILKGFEILNDAKLEAIEIKNEVFPTKISEASDGWTLEAEHYIVQEGGNVENGIIFTNHDKHSHKLIIELKKDSKAKLFFLYDLKKGDLIADVEFIAGENAELELGLIFLDGRNIYYNIHSHLEKPNSKMHMEGAYYAGDGSNYDINLEVVHDSEGAESLLNMNGILDNGSKKLYKYAIDFPKGAYGSKGEENEVVVAIGEDFQSTTVPILLVGEDSIEAAHGATLKLPDERVIDYIKSRGIDDKTAELMCVEGQFAGAIDMMDDKTRAYTIDRLEEIIKDVNNA